MVQTTSNTSLAIDSPQGRKIFVFDRVFSPEVMQDGIWEYLADSINAFTQGYNVSLLAYGQSGAGKSYTMGTSNPGEHEDESMTGKVLVPLADTLSTAQHSTPSLGRLDTYSFSQVSSPEQPLLCFRSLIYPAPEVPAHRQTDSPCQVSGLPAPTTIKTFSATAIGR